MRTLKLTSIAAVVSLVAVSTAAGTTIVFGGDVFGSYRVKPSSIHIVSNENLIKIKWSTWGGPTAKAKGTLKLSPATGGDAIPVRIELSKIRVCGKRHQYLRLKFRELANSHAGHAGQVETIDYTCSSPG
jgi:hypothetical protein